MVQASSQEGGNKTSLRPLEDVGMRGQDQWQLASRLTLRMALTAAVSG